MSTRRSVSADPNRVHELELSPYLRPGGKHVLTVSAPAGGFVLDGGFYDGAKRLGEDLDDAVWRLNLPANKGIYIVGDTAYGWGGPLRIACPALEGPDGKRTPTVDVLATPLSPCVIFKPKGDTLHVHHTGKAGAARNGRQVEPHVAGGARQLHERDAHNRTGRIHRRHIRGQ